MKIPSLSLLITLLMLFAINLNAQWYVIYSDTMNGTDILDIQFVNKDTGFAVAGLYGAQGYILRTQNGGTTWDTTWFPYNLNTIFFVNDSIGYVCGWQSRVYKTVNSGGNWLLCDTSGFLQQKRDFKTLWFKNADTGIVAKLSEVYITYDGGNSFIRDTLLGIGTEYQLFSNQYGIWMPYANILKYAEEFGNPFQAIDTLCCNFHVTDIFFKNVFNGYSTGMGWYGSPNFNYGVITKTNDRGYNWIKKDFSNVYFFTDIEFVNDTIGYCVGKGQGFNSLQYRFWKTEDGGDSWWHQNSEENNNASEITCISCVDKDNCYAAGWGSIFKTTNGGGPLVSMDASVEHYKMINLQLYPNPASTSITINISDEILFAKKTETTYKIIDKLGREVKLGSISEFPHTVSLENFNEGLYILILRNDKLIETRKFVKLNQ